MKVLEVAAQYVGARQGGPVHRALIDRYNRVLPRPSGYRMTYEDAWCDAFVTAVADEAGVSQLTGRECGVERHIKVCRGLGIWRGRVRPVPGDLVMFDWDGGGFADHIGFVAVVSGERFQTIEGNSNGRVERNWFAWNDWRVKGFARPKYEAVGAGGGLGGGSPGKSDEDAKAKTIEQLAAEVLLGTWGNHPERTRALVTAGYDALAVQAKVNQLMKGVGAKPVAKVEVVVVRQSATHFYTGERMDAWVKGSRFEVLEDKLLSGVVVYLIGYQGGVIGWVRAGDVQVVE